MRRDQANEEAPHTKRFVVDCFVQRTDEVAGPDDGRSSSTVPRTIALSPAPGSAPTSACTVPYPGFEKV